MKITFVTIGWALSGGDRVIAIYADRLRKRGHEVLLVAPAPQRPSLKAKLKGLLRGQGWRSAAVATEQPHLDPAVPRKRLDRWRPVVDGDLPDADVVIATWWETVEWVHRLSPRKGAKTWFIQHYEVFDYIPKDRVDSAWRLPLHKITISKWLVDLARVTFNDDQVSLVYNSVDTGQFHAPPRGKNTLPRIGMLYSDARWKGTDVCLDAIARLPFPVTVAAFGANVAKPGVGPHPALPPGSTYHQRPPQEFIREIYASCDVWLCGSRGEGFHLPPLEAMACRCPVVSTAVGGPIDIVRDGFNGYVVAIEDAAALADRLQRVLELPDFEWRRMSENALSTALGYTWDQATDLFEQALERAIERQTRGETG